MKKRKTSSRARPRNRFHLLFTLLALALGLSCHSCAELPSGRELAKAGTDLEAIVKELGAAVREHAGAPSATIAGKGAEQTAGGTESFAACRHFFAAGKSPVVAPRPTHRALCYDAFAILHSGESKTAVYVAEKLNRASVAEPMKPVPTSFTQMLDCDPPNGPHWMTTRPAALIAVTWRRPATCPRRRLWRRAFRLPTWCRKHRNITGAHGPSRSK